MTDLCVSRVVRYEDLHASSSVREGKIHAYTLDDPVVFCRKLGGTIRGDDKAVASLLTAFSLESTKPGVMRTGILLRQ